MELGAIAVQRLDDGAEIALSGELDLADAPVLRARIDELLDAGLSRVVVDLAAVTFLDSSMLGVLLGGARRARESAAVLSLVRPPERVARLLSITGLARLVESTPSGADDEGTDPS